MISNLKEFEKEPEIAKILQEYLDYINIYRKQIETKQERLRELMKAIERYRSHDAPFEDIKVIYDKLKNK